jgi:hypothetical protein
MRILPKLEALEPLLVAGSELGENELARRASWPYPPGRYTLYKGQDANSWNCDIFLFIALVRDKINKSRESLTGPEAVAVENLLPISQCILLFRSTEALDPRDKIYAFLGMSHDRNLDALAPLLPDYTLSPQEVYIKWSKSMLRSDAHLCLLSMVEDLSLRKIKSLPSWVPDFSTDCRPIPFRVPSPLPFSASRGLGAMDISFPELGVLEVLGFRLNEVAALARNSDLEKGGLTAIAKFLSALPRVMMIKKPIDVDDPQLPSATIDLTKYIPQSRLEVYWRTLITDRLRGEHPAPEACGQAMKINYRRWISRMAANTLGNITSIEDFSTKWQKFWDENLAFESMLLPGEMEPLVSLSNTTRP